MPTVAAIRSRCCAGPPRACGIWPRAARAGPQVHFTTVAQLLRAAGLQPAGERQDPRGRVSIPTATRSSPHQRGRQGGGRGRPAGDHVDTKKKELVGDFKNGGREWRPKGEPELVRVHDFKDKQLGKAIPYGVYDLAANEGWVSVGIDHDTAQFAVNSIRSWWQHLGQQRYPNATRLHDHRRLRRLQRQPHPAVEGRAAKARRRDRPRDRASATSRPAPANGTGSSTACSASSR